MTVSALNNESGKPPNLRQQVCGGKGLRMVEAGQFNGWGATFGKFESAAEAEAVISGIEAVRGQTMQNASSGVVRVPFTKDFVPVSFNMSQSASVSLCQQVQAAGGSCDVISPATFASFANLAGRENSKGAEQPQPQQQPATTSKQQRRTNADKK